MANENVSPEAELETPESAEHEALTDAPEEELDDDLKVLNSNDELVASTDDMAAATQGEDFMVWSIEGLYNPETEKPYRKRYLLENPPILHIENRRDDDTYFADFILTKEITATLAKSLTTTVKAYSNVSESKPLTADGLKERYQNALLWVREHVIGVSIAVVLFAFMILFGFVL